MTMIKFLAYPRGKDNIKNVVRGGVVTDSEIHLGEKDIEMGENHDTDGPSIAPKNYIALAKTISIPESEIIATPYDAIVQDDDMVIREHDIMIHDDDMMLQEDDTMIREDGQAPPNSHSHNHAHAALTAGDKVEVRYRGLEKWYKGKITRDCGDGTFDVHYDDGEQESRVLREWIRSLELARDDDNMVQDDDTMIQEDDMMLPTHSHAALTAGDKVEVRYRGLEKWYKGKITRDCGDGTFDVHYDDGEQETRVLREWIRSL